jgi:uroporphyrinogen decarboxylase
MTNILFKNALNRVEQKTPPIWFMRQAGRYHSHYQKLKEKYTFEQLCKTPELASEVACGPIKEFDFDVAILFSDILFPLEGLGIPLQFKPGPIFGDFINKDNYQKYSDIDKAIEHMNFQKNALSITREKLPPSKSLIGFVGGLWTLLRFAVDKKKKPFYPQDFHFNFMSKTLFPLIKKNIQLQLDAGAEIVMLFDSGLEDLNSSLFEKKYLFLIKNLVDSFPNKIGYYLRGRSKNEIDLMSSFSFAGLGVDHHLDINYFLNQSLNGFVQGNFNEQKMTLDEFDLSREINSYCDRIISNGKTTGWICGLGHGINKLTPEKNVHLFIDLIRKRFN